jgi:hypothetical protein
MWIPHVYLATTSLSPPLPNRSQIFLSTSVIIPFLFISQFQFWPSLLSLISLLIPHHVPLSCHPCLGLGKFLWWRNPNQLACTLCDQIYLLLLYLPNKVPPQPLRSGLPKFCSENIKYMIVYIG